MFEQLSAAAVVVTDARRRFKFDKNLYQLSDDVTNSKQNPFHSSIEQRKKLIHLSCYVRLYAYANSPQSSLSCS